MKVRSIAVRAVAAVTLAGSVITVPAGFAQAASAASCTTRVENTHSVTSKGTRSAETLRKVTCGTSYREWEHRVTDSYTGSTSVLDMYKIGTTKPAHYREWETTTSTSKTGTVSVRHTYTSN